MPKSSLLIIHQGALGDFILIFPAVIQLRQYYEPIDVFCHSQMGKLAGVLNLVDNWFPAEASSFSSLYSDQADPKIKSLLNRYEKIILFTISNQLEQAIRSVTTSFICQMPPKPPVHQSTHVSRFILENIRYCSPHLLRSQPLLRRCRRAQSPVRRRHTREQGRGAGDQEIRHQSGKTRSIDGLG